MSSDIPNIPPYPGSLRTLNDAMRFAASRETFEIRSCALYAPGEEAKDIYLIALRGTDQSLDKNDMLGVFPCLKAFRAKPNIYYDAVWDKMFSVIPAGASVAMIGHSFGGMVAQQISADETVKKTYDMLNVVAIGSPYVPVSGRECPLRRFADSTDVIPWLGHSLKGNFFAAKPVFKNNGYFGSPEKAHTDSYRESSSWLPFDPFGVPGGGRIIVIGPLAESAD